MPSIEPVAHGFTYTVEGAVRNYQLLVDITFDNPSVINSRVVVIEGSLCVVNIHKDEHAEGETSFGSYHAVEYTDSIPSTVSSIRVKAVAPGGVVITTYTVPTKGAERVD
jgi:hypothetical protein